MRNSIQDPDFKGLTSPKQRGASLPSEIKSVEDRNSETGGETKVWFCVFFVFFTLYFYKKIYFSYIIPLDSLPPDKSNGIYLFS